MNKMAMDHFEYAVKRLSSWVRKGKKKGYGVLYFRALAELVEDLRKAAAELEG